jgi:hypothetical protein
MTMKNWLLAGGVACILAVSGVTGALAAAPTPINKFTDWTASTYDDSGKTLCYATSEPKKQAGKFTSRGKPYIAITHAPQANVRDQVSYIAGYEFKPDSTVSVTIGKQTFSLDLLQKDRAWAKDSDTDKALVAAMRKGNTLVITGTSSRGTEITDTYSLNGFTKAYLAIGAACKIQ